MTIEQRHVQQRWSSLRARVARGLELTQEAADAYLRGRLSLRVRRHAPNPTREPLKARLVKRYKDVDTLHHGADAQGRPAIWPPQQTRGGVTLRDKTHYHFWTDGSLRHDPPKRRGKAAVKRAKKQRAREGQR